MLNANRLKTFFIFSGLGVFGLLGCGGCSSGSKQADLPFERSSQEMSFDSLWEEDFPGPLTDIALARKSGDVAVASIPDPDLGGKHLLSLIDRKGKKIFQFPSPAPVKSLDVSDDGSRIVVNNYEGRLIGYDRSGTPLWSTAASCRPMVLNSVKRVLCYHDDDTRPSVAFEVFDWEGKRLSTFPIKSDVLAMKVSVDERWLGIGLSGGRLLVFGITPSGEVQLDKEWKVPGEILDLSISQGDQPTLASLSIDVKKGQLLTVFEAKKQKTAEMRLSYHVEQVEVLPAGKLVALYGNSPRGQYLALHSSYDATLQWQKIEPRYADYSLAIRVGEDRLLAGFEQTGTTQDKTSPQSRKSRLVALDIDGKLRADLTLKTTEGAYLYSFSYSPDRSLVAVGTDDKRLQLYELR